MGSWLVSRGSLLVVLCVALPAAARGAAAPTIVDAAEQGDRSTVLRLLSKGGNPNTPAADGTTAIMWASANGDVELVRALVRAGADVRLKNQFGTTAVTEAAIVGSAPILDVLLKAGADPNVRNPEGETPIMAAARSGKVEAARVLVEAGADVNAKEEFGGQSALMWAAAQSQAEMVKFLASSGADVNARGVIRNWERKVITEPRPKDMNQGGFTPLLYAAREGCVECAKHLMAAGADPSIADPHMVAPLTMALLNLHFELAKYLVEAGADLNQWDFYGRSPVYMAADVSTLPTKGNGAMAVLPSEDKVTALDVAKLMLEKGANPNIQLKRRPPYRDVPQDRSGDVILAQGATPLLRAARAGDAELVELLLQHGALVDLPSNQGVTPLMAAAGLEYGLRVTRGRNRTTEGVLKTMQLLLDAGADINARELAEPAGDAAAHQLVIEQRLSDYSYDYRGRQVPSPHAIPHRTALHGAAMKGFNPIVEFLAAHGADLYAKDANGRTALDLALGNYNEPFLRQKAEPHTETAALLKTLMAANPAPEATARAGGDGGGK